VGELSSEGQIPEEVRLERGFFNKLRNDRFEGNPRSGKQMGVPAAKEEQRLAGEERSGQHLADDDRVIAGNVRRMKPADDLTQDIVEQRNILLRPKKFHIEVWFVFFRLFGARKKFREQLLVFPQDIDAEHPFCLEQRQQVGVLVHAHRNERRD